MNGPPMQKSFFLLTATAAGLLAALPAVGAAADQATAFEARIRPVLVARCISCHGPDKQKAGLRLDSLAAMLRGGESGPAIVAGDAAASNLVAAIRHESWEMPPDGRLADGEIEALAAWIDAGSPWPGSPSAAELLAAGLPDEEAPPAFGPPLRKLRGVVTEADRQSWAYRPVERPAVPPRPAGEGLPDGLLRGAVHNEIDLFVLATLAESGIEPVPEADRETLVRRLFFDLLGLPPEPADVAGFAADQAPDAYERLVDRLLADPRYGERQARLWLDLARYAESDGFRQDAFRPAAWRYRDWCVAAFNDDLPYDRFVALQLAGDELSPGDPAALVATGFLRQTPYEYNQVDVESQRAAILDEVTAATADVFLAMGLACARCHDHKYDPLLQRDYYALQAFFAPLVWRDDVPLDPPGWREELAGPQLAAVARAAELRAALADLGREHAGPDAWRGFGRFPPEIQALILAPAADRTPHEEQIVQLAARQLKLLPDKLPEPARTAYAPLAAELADLQASGSLPKRPTGIVVADVGPVPPPTLIPGRQAAGPVEPGVPEVLGGGPLPLEPLRDEDGRPLSTGRRAALAKWIASPDNPLTARVLVNRAWQWHFGRGLIATASDFGTLGERASHPELLDWLAAEFVARGWSFKELHRLIVTSAAYRRGSRATAAAGTAGPSLDPLNRLLWRQNPRRLDAEQVRDAALAIAGELDPARGGPSVPATKPRRAIYTTVLRNTRDPICEVFDGADAYASCAARNATTTPLQSLFLVNGEWMLARARSLAAAIAGETAGETAALEPLAAAAIRRVTGREPAAGRVAAAAAFLIAQQGRLPDDASSHAAAPAQRMPHREGLAAVVDPARPEALLRTQADGLPAGDFTIEAHVILQSLFADATVRVIASRWSGEPGQPGWSLGVTSEKSRYRPRNLILQLAGDQARGGSPYEVVPSGIHLELQRPYYVAASVRISDPAERLVTFFVKDLSDNDAPLVEQRVPVAFSGSHASPRRLVIGGRDAGRPDPAGASIWDGLIDDVRLSDRPLARVETLWEGGDPGAAVVAHWTFEDAAGFTADSSGRGRHLVPGGGAAATASPRFEALVDLCHVLFNSSEFLHVE